MLWTAILNTGSTAVHWQYSSECRQQTRALLELLCLGKHQADFVTLILADSKLVLVKKKQEEFSMVTSQHELHHLASHSAPRHALGDHGHHACITVLDAIRTLDESICILLR